MDLEPALRCNLHLNLQFCTSMCRSTALTGFMQMHARNHFKFSLSTKTPAHRIMWALPDAWHPVCSCFDALQ